ncbi:MAG: AmmeMemoRadiSam system protein B [Nitrospira sp.]|nr:AmmeMemoRadiSam system protein B [Nitrospira sp.]
MKIRKPFRAGSFYPSSRVDCVELLEACLSRSDPQTVPTEESQRILAGIVPHAGWMYSGPTAGKVFYRVKEKIGLTQEPAPTFLIYGAVHVWGAEVSSIYPEGYWETPLGKIEIDHELAEHLLSMEDIPVIANPGVHEREHSIEVEVPFIQHLFPHARILPIMVPPDQQAAFLGKRIGDFLLGWAQQVVILGSTDLTHYGPAYGFMPSGVGSQALAWSKNNDRQIIQLALEMKAEEVVPEAQSHHNACGAGAMAATVATARALDTQKGILLEHTTSYEVKPEWAEDFVGYAGIIFG